MKKVGLLTYHSVSNFGANLQTLSTVSYLRNRGYDVVLINWMPEDLDEYYIKQVHDIQRKEHAAFVHKYLPITKLCRTSKDVQNVIFEENLSSILIGSDAVFSYKPILRRFHLSRKSFIAYTPVTTDHTYPNPFWGDFKSNDDIKLISLSASAQFLDLNRCLCFERKHLKDALEKFNYISVRDTWTKQIVEKLTGRQAYLTPDPVWAFNQNCSLLLQDFDNLRSKYHLAHKYAILSFCKLLYPDGWYEDLYSKLHDQGFQVVNLAMPEGCINVKSDIVIDIPLNPIDWYAIIQNSSAYIGQRMHPMIVAFHNNVPFYIFDHYLFKTGKPSSSKIYDILERSEHLSQYTQVNSTSIVTPGDVVISILNFDKFKARQYAEKYLTAYNDMMEDISKFI